MDSYSEEETIQFLKDVGVISMTVQTPHPITFKTVDQDEPMGASSGVRQILRHSFGVE